jgi:hypothetical protein
MSWILAVALFGIGLALGGLIMLVGISVLTVGARADACAECRMRLQKGEAWES